ncbi:MAG: TetR/AcrR family transcriptional regulator [Syntrophomonadaceae bacterium]|nr:TetR/AcrR family transcriptional regulator [Syntrophomonadaceae bacterium]
MSLVMTSSMQEKRNIILECALDLFAEKGYVNTPVRDIIDRSGFGTGTFYKYFNNKENVLTVLLDAFLGQIIASVNEFFAKEKNLYLRFIESKRAILEVFIQNEKMAEIYSRVRGTDGNIGQCIKDFDDRFIFYLAQNNEYGIHSGTFRDVPVLPIACSTLATINYFVYKWIVMKEISAEEMISMVISFHNTLAIGLFEPEHHDRIYGEDNKT